MAWVDGEQVMQRVEQFVKALWREFAGRGTTPFIRMTYDEAMSRHGSDKPDLRIPGEVSYSSPLRMQLIRVDPTH